MISLKLFVQYHDQKKLDQIPDCPHLSKHLIEDTCIAESLFLYYLSQNLHLLDREYIGIAAASWDDKYTNDRRRETPALTDLGRLRPFPPDHVLAADRTDRFDWYAWSDECHKGMRLLLDELYIRNGFDKYGHTIWANNFICHRDVMVKFLAWWEREFRYFIGKYGKNLPYEKKPQYAKRHPAYFLERLTCAYFCNLEGHVDQIDKGMLVPKMFI